MYEKAPANIQISHPLSNGVIADINNMERLIHLFISDMSKGNIRPADFYIAVPTDITEVEKRAFYDLIKDANVKARKIMVVEKAIADGLGMVSWLWISATIQRRFPFFPSAASC